MTEDRIDDADSIVESATFGTMVVDLKNVEEVTLTRVSVLPTPIASMIEVVQLPEKN